MPLEPFSEDVAARHLVACSLATVVFRRPRQCGNNNNTTVWLVTQVCARFNCRPVANCLQLLPPRPPPDLALVDVRHLIHGHLFERGKGGGGSEKGLH